MHFLRTEMSVIRFIFTKYCIQPFSVFISFQTFVNEKQLTFVSISFAGGQDVKVLRISRNFMLDGKILQNPHYWPSQDIDPDNVAYGESYFRH